MIRKDLCPHCGEEIILYSEVVKPALAADDTHGDVGPKPAKLPHNDIGAVGHGIPSGHMCFDCGHELYRSGACMTCSNCGYQEGCS